MKVFYIDPTKYKKIKNNFDHLILKDVPIPNPKKNELLIKTLSCGLCATDISKILNLSNNRQNLKKKIYLGHEVIGKVIKSGDKNFKYLEGKKVAIGDISICKSFSFKHECNNCRKKRGIYCINKHKKKNDPKVYAGFSEYFVRTPQQCIVLNNNANITDNIFVEPLSSCLNLLRNSNLNDKILINGFGTIAILFYKLLLTKKYKNENIFFSDDISTYKKNFLIKNNAQLVSLKLKKNINKFTVCYDFNERFKGDINLTSSMLPFSKIILFGLNNPGKKNSDLSAIVQKAIKIVGVHGYSSYKKNDKYITDLETASKIIYKNAINTHDLIEDVFPLEKIRNKIIKILKNISEKKKQFYFRTIFVNNKKII